MRSGGKPRVLDDTVEWMRTQAGTRWPALELHALVQSVAVTPDRHRVCLGDHAPHRDERWPTSCARRSFVSGRQRRWRST